VRVTDPDGRFLGTGLWSPKSAIPLRIWSRDAAEKIDDALIGRRIDAAFALRARLGLPSDRNQAYRLLNSEGDDTPGLIVDIFHKVAVVQFRTIGALKRAEAIFGHITRATGVKTILCPATEIKAEGIHEAARVARGSEVDALEFLDRGFSLRIPSALGQKTGYYLDQRITRDQVEAVARGRVLDAYSYVGSIGLAAARGGADEVVCIDSSAPAVAAGAAIAQHHDLLGKVQFQKADIRRKLPELAKAGETFDLVVVDPPKLIPSKRHMDRGRKAYVQLNRLAAPLVERGGLLMSCSCSAALGPAHFLRAVNEGARRAGRHLTLIWSGGQPGDHPTPAAFPEGRYLKSLLFRVD
jgi:23S rRNA (cytosine1962-C5)-methyltransferase